MMRCCNFVQGIFSLPPFKRQSSDPCPISEDFRRVVRNVESMGKWARLVGQSLGLGLARFVDGPLKVLLLQVMAAKSESGKSNCLLEKRSMDEKSRIKHN